MRLIDADALKAELSANCPDDEMAKAIVEIFKACIDNAPTIEGRKTGKWVDNNLGFDGYYANCSECGYQIDVHENRGYPNYCENCGADMRGDEE